MAKIDTQFMAKTAEKPHPLGPHIPIWPIKGSTLPGPLSSSSRKYPGCGWSRVYVYKLNPHRRLVFDLIVSTLSMEVEVALPYRRYFES